MKRHSLAVLLVMIFSVVMGQSNNPPGLNLIRQQDLKKDLYELASAKYRGRSAGTIDELKAAIWLADQYRAIGLKPAGDDGTYFQFFDMVRNRIADQSTIKLNGAPLQLWKDILVAQMADVDLAAPVMYLGNAKNLDTGRVDVEGKIVAIEADATGINLDVSLPTWRYNRYIYAKYGLPLVRRGAIAVVFIADPIAEDAWEDAAENYKRGSYDITGGPNEKVTTTVPVFWVHSSAKPLFMGSTPQMVARIGIETFAYPSVNIIGEVQGTDAQLKKEYVLYSGHTDAHGVRNPIKNDTIYYGADDNGSVDVAMLANARAFVKYPAKRSVLFVIHGAEERGLLGSRYYTQNPTVPLQNIVAVLNGDMIGRNTPDSAAILGVIPPHRTSADLVKMALEANKEGPNFKLDTEWDKASHIEGWYFRSDHLPYARLGIPSLMYTTLLHPDYHTPQDNAENINYPKLHKMASWMYRTGWKAANSPSRPGKERDFKLER